MPIHHAKTSGIPNGDPALVGGGNWDDPHVVSGPAVVDLVSLWLTTGGAITSANWYLLNFSKTGTGTYRAQYDPADFAGADPIVVPALSVGSGAPRFVRWSLTNDGTNDYIQLETVDAAGAAVDVASARLTLVAGANF